ncbi:hypothetical protein [Maribellus maritimus]|uniref:hypothetical protein n=1 Tax=Maribellus maritimus TaxID=2870838 RepID=UPI001EEA1BFC|nr:hypothetical protein [Maribellus maritimus]MCG6191373.1 hypothetical protein [Maribellus maritimus]
MEKINQLEGAIREFDTKYVLEKSPNISVLNDITEKQIHFHKSKLHLNLDRDEKPLVLVNTKKGVRLYGFSGFVLTNKKIHFSLTKRFYFASFLPLSEKPRKLNLESIDSFQIGEHDSCFGSTYVGHDLVINEKTLGLVRLGFGLMYDEEALVYINELSKFLFENGFLKSTPKEYRWQ